MRWVGDDEEDVFVTPDLKSLAFDTRSASSGRYFKVRWDGARIAVAAFVWMCMCVFHAHAHKIRLGPTHQNEDAGVAEKCKAMDLPELPMGAHLQNDVFRLYLGDSGLLLSMLESQVQEDVRVRRNLGTWKGALFENIVGEALVKAGAALAYYRKENSTLEMDFFLRSENCLVPIEVKGENNRAQSLRTLIASDNYKDISWGVKLVHGNVGFENNVLTLPQWCAFLLPRVIKANRMT